MDETKKEQKNERDIHCDGNADSVSDFTKIIRYKCKWCGKLFATQKHQCKFNPKKRNCFSCRHARDYHQRIPAEYDHQTLGLIDPGTSSWIECDLGNDGYNDIGDMQSQEWEGLGCEDYETMPGYKGSQSYSDRIYETQREARKEVFFNRKQEGSV